MSKNNKIIITVTAVILILVAVTLGLFFGLRNNDDNKETPIVDDNYLISTEYFHVDPMDKYDDQALAIHFKVDLSTIDFGRSLDTGTFVKASGMIEIEVDIIKDLLSGWYGMHYQIYAEDFEVSVLELTEDLTGVHSFDYLKAKVFYMENFDVSNLRKGDFQIRQQIVYLSDTLGVSESEWGGGEISLFESEEVYGTYLSMNDLEDYFDMDSIENFDIHWLETTVAKDYSLIHFGSTVHRPELVHKDMSCIDGDIWMNSDPIIEFDGSKDYLLGFYPEQWYGIFVPGFASLKPN